VVFLAAIEEPASGEGDCEGDNGEIGGSGV